MDEPHRVRDDGVEAARQANPAARWIEGGKEAIFGEHHAAPDQAIEERRLSSIRVANDGNGRFAACGAALCARLAAAAHLVDAGFHHGDAIANQAAVGLKLRLTGAARADAAART